MGLDVGLGAGGAFCYVSVQMFTDDRTQQKKQQKHLGSVRVLPKNICHLQGKLSKYTENDSEL